MHHIIAYAQPAGGDARTTSGRARADVSIGGITPNKPGWCLRAGRRAAAAAANSDIVLQMHYTTNGAATTDRTRSA